jgi:divalent metal cation (Fe/Co/Zn/Cd) transporter
VDQQGGDPVRAALLANLGVAVAKLAAFTVTRSASILAEAIHSLADTANQALLYLGRHAARRGPDEIGRRNVDDIGSAAGEVQPQAVFMRGHRERTVLQHALLQCGP